MHILDLTIAKDDIFVLVRQEWQSVSSGAF
jgi:hypothetical protein